MKTVLGWLALIGILCFVFYRLDAYFCPKQVVGGEVVKFVTIDDQETGKQTKIVVVRGKSNSGALHNREVEVDDFEALNLGDTVHLQFPKIKVVKDKSDDIGKGPWSGGGTW